MTSTLSPLRTLMKVNARHEYLTWDDSYFLKLLNHRVSAGEAAFLRNVERKLWIASEGCEQWILIQTNYSGIRQRSVTGSQFSSSWVCSECFRQAASVAGQQDGSFLMLQPGFLSSQSFFVKVLRSSILMKG